MNIRVFRNFEHITEAEAHCPCGCGLVANDWLLNLSEKFLEKVGSPTKITSLVRCKEYNHHLYNGESYRFGYDNSPHLLNEEGYGAGDFAYMAKRKGSDMIWLALEFFNSGEINHIEICDRHIHIAKTDHPALTELIQWGRSK